MQIVLDAPRAALVHFAGHGQVATAHARYPLGDLTYAANADGRGVVELTLGSGALRLSGVDADHPSAMRYILHIDVMQIQTLEKAEGACDLEVSPNGSRYRSLRCRLQARRSGEAVTVRWESDSGRKTEP